MSLPVVSVQFFRVSEIKLRDVAYSFYLASKSKLINVFLFYF